MSQIITIQERPDITSPGTAFTATGILFSSTDAVTFTGSTALLSWPSLAGAVSYCIRISTTPNFEPNITEIICNITSTSYLFSSASARQDVDAQTYYYQVQGIDSLGNYSLWSNTPSFVLIQGGAASILDKEFPQQFTILPNPSKGEFTLKSSFIGLGYILDYLGKEIQHFYVSESEQRISVNLKPGLYMIKLGIKAQKLIIE